MDKIKEKILLCLAERRSLSMIKELKCLTGYHGETIRKYVDQLENEGIIIKTQNRGEPKKKSLSLTDKGDRVVSALEELLRVIE